MRNDGGIGYLGYPLDGIYPNKTEEKHDASAGIDDSNFGIDAVEMCFGHLPNLRHPEAVLGELYFDEHSAVGGSIVARSGTTFQRNATYVIMGSRPRFRIPTDFPPTNRREGRFAHEYPFSRSRSATMPHDTAPTFALRAPGTVAVAWNLLRMESRSPSSPSARWTISAMNPSVLCSCSRIALRASAPRAT